MMLIFPLCILRTFQVPIFILCLQLRGSRCPLARSASEPPFGFSPVASLGPVAPVSLSRSFPEAVESHSGLTICDYCFFFIGYDSFLGTLTEVVCHCLPLGVFHETPSLMR